MQIFFYMFFFIYFFATVSAAQECKSDSIPSSTPDSQLTDNSDNTISDTKTGLMWKKCVEGVSGNICNTGTPTTFNWQQALEQPGVINNAGGFAGYSDWRLPNIKELSSIVERQCTDPAINLNRFPNTQSVHVWSGSPHVRFDNDTWDVNFNDGTSRGSNSPRNHMKQVRLVRGGQ